MTRMRTPRQSNARTSAPAVVLATLLVTVALSTSGCGDGQVMPNSPYPAEEAGRGIYYTTYTTAPKTLDPGRAYSSDLYDIIGPIYDPPLGYHLFRHPLRQLTPLIPNTAADLPEPLFQLKRRTAGLTLDDAARPTGEDEAVEVRLDIGSRAGLEVGDRSLVLEWEFEGTGPDGSTVTGGHDFPLEIRELHDYWSVAVLYPQAMRGEWGTVPIEWPAGTAVSAVSNWSRAEEVELREYINERTRQADRDAALERWRESGDGSQTRAAHDGGSGRFAAPTRAPEITFALPSSWRWQPAREGQVEDRLTTPTGTPVIVRVLERDPTVDAPEATAWHPDHPLRIRAAREFAKSQLPAAMAERHEIVAGGRIPVAVVAGPDMNDSLDGGAVVVGVVIERNRAVILQASVGEDRMQAATDELFGFLQSASSTRLPLPAADGRVIVDVHIQPGIYYAPHPCFARDPGHTSAVTGEPAYRYHPGFERAGTVNRLRRLADELADEVTAGGEGEGEDEDDDAVADRRATIQQLIDELAERDVVIRGEDPAAREASVLDALAARGHWLTHDETASKFRISDFDITRGVAVRLTSPLPVDVTTFPETLTRRLRYEFDEADGSGSLTWYGHMLPRDQRELEALAPGGADARDLWLRVVKRLAEGSRRVATRELTAADYVLGIKRMANPLTQCPILEQLERFVVGYADYHHALATQLANERDRRRREQGIAYSQDVDERENPLRLDLDAHPCPGVGLVRDDDRYTLRIILNQPWPQLRYWLAMPFFSPVPWEALSFFRQAPLAANDITLTRFPVGTGPYRLAVYDRTREVRLVRNECYRRDPFPTIWDEVYDDLTMTETLLHLAPEAPTRFADAGRMLPLMDEVVFKLEKEQVPRWHKFLLGYYDKSVIRDDQFEGVVDVGTDGMTLRTEMADRRITMDREPVPTIYYFGFNMRDPVLGGPTLDEALSEEKCKLRQALSIILDIEEFNDIFYNGRYLPAQGPIPPGILGNRGDPALDVNPYVYTWNDAAGRRQRKSVETARRLMEEAGYPDGKDETGQVLTIHFDCSWVGPAYQTRFDWIKKRFDLLGINFKERATDYNRYQEKIDAGKHEMFFWGWNADYPDPENFLFLFYGPNRATSLPGDDRGRGPNSANYENPEFDRLFERMATMPDDVDLEDWSDYVYREHQRHEAQPNGVSDRLEIIRHMVEILRHDAPWAFGFYRVAMSLRHHWVRNGHVNELAQDILKYRHIDAAARERYRRRFNEPVWWPLWTLIAVAVLTAVPAAVTVWRRNNAAM